MSFTPSAQHLRDVAEFLDRITEATTKTAVKIGAYSRFDIEFDGMVLNVKWDAVKEQYVVHDEVGS